MNLGLRARMAWTVAVVAGTVAAACTPPSHRIRPLTDDARVDAVISFAGGSGVESQFALRAPARLDWSSAPTIAAPTGVHGGHTADGAADSTQRPLLIIVRGEVRDRPWISVSVLPVGPGDRRGRPLHGTLATAVPTRACVGGSWMSAFFLEGFGPRPTAPATLYVRSDDSLYSLRIDHERDMLRASPALQVLRRDVLPRLTSGEDYAVIWQASRTLPAMPLVAARESRGWNGSGGLGLGGRWGSHTTYGSAETGPVEWQLFILGVPAPC